MPWRGPQGPGSAQRHVRRPPLLRRARVDVAPAGRRIGARAALPRGPRHGVRMGCAGCWRPGSPLLPPGVARVLRRLRGADAPVADTPRAAGARRHERRPRPGRRALRPSQHHNVLGLFAAHWVAARRFTRRAPVSRSATRTATAAWSSSRSRLPERPALSAGRDPAGGARGDARPASPRWSASAAARRRSSTLFRRGVVERERHAILAALARGRPVWCRLVRERWVDRAAPGTRRAGNDEVVLVQCAALGEMAGQARRATCYKSGAVKDR